MWLSARPENVAVVRQALTGLGDAFGIEPSVLAGMKVAVSEACTNVVQHAYRDEPVPGPLEVESRVNGEEVHIAVRDKGCGMMPRRDSPGMGLGIPLIAALSESLQLRGTEGGGTEVAMRFNLQEPPPVEAAG
jgi:anti-sigma regulatory factor (Ser/Thr protein kinase)